MLCSMRWRARRDRLSSPPTGESLRRAELASRLAPEFDPREIYIVKAPIPGPLGPGKLMGAEPAPQTFTNPHERKWRGRD
jgi:hypothetical protein